METKRYIEDYDNLLVVSHPEDKIVERVVFDMVRRSHDGIKKYGCSMPEAQMSAYQAIKNALEEAQDLCIYLSKALYEMDKAMLQGDKING